jgi:hypothetical protein
MLDMLIQFFFVIFLFNFLSNGNLNIYAKVVEAPDGSVCFNNCNGHGDCREYTCHCHIGYHGDDCKTTFVKEGDPIIPILGNLNYLFIFPSPNLIKSFDGSINQWTILIVI